MIALAGGDKLASTLVVEKVAPRDWVKESLIGLRPVTAGRFVVHGAHDRARVPSHCIGIEIEAATAFGTGHHGTTRGCLLALDALARRRSPPASHPRSRHRLGRSGDRRGQDFPRAGAGDRHRSALGCTSRATTRGSTASARWSRRCTPRTCARRDVIKRAPFDLVLANILLRPLQRLAAPVARQLVPNARVVTVRSAGRAGERGARRLPVAGADAGALVRARRLGHAGDGGAVGLNAGDDARANGASAMPPACPASAEARPREGAGSGESDRRMSKRSHGAYPQLRKLAAPSPRTSALQHNTDFEVPSAGAMEHRSIAPAA